MIFSSANIGRNDPGRYLADAGRCKFISSANVGQNDPRRYSDDAGRFKLIHNAQWARKPKNGKTPYMTLSVSRLVVFPLKAIVCDVTSQVLVQQNSNRIEWVSVLPLFIKVEVYFYGKT